ncbi:MAG: S8 family serine peptidase, partial [Sphingomonadales bacterium]
LSRNDRRGVGTGACFIAFAAVAAQAKVVNISLGGSSPNSNLRSAIDRATAAGTIIVISAGNDGVTNPAAATNPSTLAQIANDPTAHGLVIISGAVNENGALADFSNKAGNSAANYLTALGVSVRSVDQTGTAYMFSGTSFSTPVISGAVALLAQAFPNLTPQQIVALLYRSATDRGATGVDGTYGNGELNIARAFSPIGSLSLPNSAVPVSLTSNATLGGAMGDAGQGGMSAVVRDEFGRDFSADLSGTIARTGLTQPLGNALSVSGSRGLSASGGRASFAIAIDNSGQGQRLLLTSGQAERARVLAGAMSYAVSKTLKFGFGAGRGADGLVPSPQDRGAPAFLITDHSLDRAPLGAFAVRRSFGGLGLTVAAESGDMRLWERGNLGPRAEGYRRYGYGETSVALDMVRGSFAMTAKLTRLNETATVLGSRFDAALGGNGAVTWFGDANVAFDAGSNWRITGQLRQGWTSLGANAVRGASTLVSRSLSAGVERQGIFMGGDSFAVRYAEPLRVTGGALALDLSGTGYQAVSLTPQGHERDWEAVYARPLGTGWLTANAYFRQQPGHYAMAPNDVGAAVRYSVNF